VSLLRRRWSSDSGLRDGSGLPVGDDDEPTPGPGPGPGPRKPPGDCSVFLFPGQGTQFVGMGRGLLRYGNVRQMFEAAQRILGYDLLTLCLHGPAEELSKTVHCQPAVFITSLAAVERLNHENPQVIRLVWSGLDPTVCGVSELYTLHPCRPSRRVWPPPGSASGSTPPSFSPAPWTSLKASRGGYKGQRSQSGGSKIEERRRERKKIGERGGDGGGR